MKPHRRKSTPPRRQTGAEEPSEEEQRPPAEVPPEAPADESTAPEETNVDPAAYGEPPEQDPGYADPNQASVEPGTYEESTEEPVPPPVVTPPPISAGAAGPAGGAGVYDDPPPAGPPGAGPPGAAPKPKKKAARRRPPPRRPATPAGARRTPYRRPQPSYGGGVSMMTVFVSIVALGMLALIAMVGLPKEDLSNVAGYPHEPMAEEEPRNLLDEAQRVMMDRTSSIAFSEAEVNAYLNHRIEGEQSGVMATLVEFKGVYVDFSPEIAEIIVEREIFGMPLTISSKVHAEPYRGQIIYRPAGWTLGRVELGKRNIKPVIGMFLRLRDTFQEEFATLKQMMDVRFEQDRLVLDAAA
ncbi:MAG: hypothetical protein WD342_10000 [Verrucomicrobiales bacterium]